MKYSTAQLDNLRDKIRQIEEPDRFRHTLGVEKEVAAMGAVFLAEQVSELRAAALLHDVTKCYRNEEQIAFCHELGLTLDKCLLQSPQVIHGVSAAAWIPKAFPEFATKDILDAICCHTTGKADMTVFSQILFVADFTEEGRTYDACRELRRKFWKSVETDTTLLPLKKAVLEELEFTVAYLKRKERPCHPLTGEALNSIRKELEILNGFSK